MRSTLLLLTAFSLLALQACKTGYNRSPIDSNDVVAPTCETEPTNVDATDNTKKVYSVLANFTCSTSGEQGVLMGQALGSGNELVTGDPSLYELLINGVAEKKVPALISIDYEKEKIFNAQELSDANDKLIEHWKAQNDSGFVMVSWMPLNPWINDESDIDQDPGESADKNYSEDVDLAELIDENSSMNQVWRKKLDRIAAALQELEDEDVTVLFVPLPAMNTDVEQYWWSIPAIRVSGDLENADAYKNLWQDMYEYFTDTKDLNNLLWVYNPAEGMTLSTSADQVEDGAPVDWAYPGDDYVDVVAGRIHSDQLIIADYQALLDLDKPLGMAPLGPSKRVSAEGDFDNRAYGETLKGSYSFIGFWVTPNSEDGVPLSLVDNKFTDELLENTYVITLEDSDLRNLRN